MQRRHEKYPLPGQLESRHLQNHGAYFGHKNASDHEQQELLFNQYRRGPEHPAQSQRTGIPHKYLGRMSVKP